MVKNKLIFERSITRDWCMITGQFWHEALTTSFAQEVGWRYTDIIYLGIDNAIVAYRAPSEHIDSMRAFIKAEIDKDPKWLRKHIDKTEERTEQAIAFIDNFKNRDISKISNNELLDIFKKGYDDQKKFGSAFIILLWFPIQMENQPDFNKYKIYVDDCFKARSKVERLGPIQDMFYRIIAKEVIKRADLPEELYRFISYQEIIDFLQDNKKPDQTILKQRSKYYLITVDGIIYDTLGHYLDNKGYQLQSENVDGMSEVRGTIAYNGKVVGTAKILRTKEMFSKFKQGDILIAAMTTPDFLPVMKKAAAFITDEGGMTCHAAIVARELKIPCIIGTKLATKIFKDGDRVEVDANEGIVRKVK